MMKLWLLVAAKIGFAVIGGCAELGERLTLPGPLVPYNEIVAGSAKTSKAECNGDPEWVEDINLAVLDAMQKSGTPGLALGVIRQGEVVYLQGHGVERSGASIVVPVTCRTRFHAASVSKPLIATAFMQAFGAGELSEDQPLGELLGEGDLRPTLGSLMTHTSGMRDWLRADTRRTEAQKDAYLRQILRRARRVEPGKQHRYSDTNYNLLAIAFERKFGGSLDAEMQDRIFGRLGMKDSSFSHVETGSAFAWPHAGSGNRPLARHPFDVAFAGSSGLQTSARDLLLFARAYLDADTRLMSTEIYAEATRPRHESQWEGMAQSLVWQVVSVEGQTIWQHGGSDDGFRSLVTLYPASRSAIVILANGEELDRGALRRELEQLIGVR